MKIGSNCEHLNQRTCGGYTESKPGTSHFDVEIEVVMCLDCKAELSRVIKSEKSV